ncbi:hypothetical protein KKY53_10635 [Pseudomonas aeruginosa]|uniref:hypothetical protein n=1 Tax=Pseudomonas aeruginosa TaxID=287 RepID=UPI00053E3D1F|nr:hypothetical protein [Pseudomonas aeruginosa]WCV80980.1 hypothetical protein KKY53_10635 [Pseudomonas aeruginosa]HBO0859700.1 hypothetical protein [Pseudomonas aeruginosa]HCE6879251.1 hypothetical protein [Pseudomonas aeruginosa]HDR2971519.1 hypothetical protein [Pseudomonas aeruginosa]
MSDLFYQCTRNDAPSQGLLGQGTLPYPEVIANRAIPRVDLGGDYVTDELSGATYLAADLAQPDSEATADENLEDLGLLVTLYGTMKQKGLATAAELEDLRKSAEAIPVVGPLLFSPTNLPAVMGSLTGIVHASSQTRQVIDLLKVSGSIKREIIAWSAARSRGTYRPLNKAARKRIRITYQNGKLILKVPASTLAPYYNLGSINNGRHIHVSANGASQLLNSRVTPNTNMYGTRGAGRVLGHPLLSAALTFGPQGVADARESQSFKEFVDRSAYTQPTNGVVFAVGLGVTAAAITFGAPVIAAFAVSIAIGAGIQLILNSVDFNQKVGDLWNQ